MEKTNIILAGLPGDMPTRVKNVIDEIYNFELTTLTHLEDRKPHYIALTGLKLKDKDIDKEYQDKYRKETNTDLIKPENHEGILATLKEEYKDSLFGINFATKEGYDVNFKFVKYGIPFISGVTGASKEQENELEKVVKESGICAVIDKNMSPALVVFGAMLKYASQTFPRALEGYSGYGIDSHQSTKKDEISGTLVKWAEPIKELGINFIPTKGDRTADYGHGDHFIRIASPDGTVKLTFQTEVLGRDTYAQGTVEKAMPFLTKKMDQGEKGQVYTMIDVLKG
ncbi:MAG: hypothetical protein KAU20_07195 [Nanoarchaeota archaeon]|nr:hypothetical protein [Nanoarchaeota archaeon]